MPQFSIVVPIYQVEDYIGECLSSIEAQTFEDFEVLCVVDGSIDASEAIARSYSERDGRFRVIVKENGGLSSARNCGIEHAGGEIVMFVDSDDAIKPDCCQHLSEAFAASGAEAVVFGADVVPADATTPWYDQVLSPEARRCDSFAADFALAGYMTPFAWRVAVRREALTREGVRFDESLPFGEDVVFQMALYPRVGALASIPDKLYRYRVRRTGSLMDGRRSAAGRLGEHLRMLEAVFADWQQLGLLERHADSLHQWSRDFWAYGLDDLNAQQQDEHIAQVRSLLGRYLPSSVTGALEVEERCLCRGDGAFYVECAIRAPFPFTKLHCTARTRGRSVPTGAYPLDAGTCGPEQRWVLELPWVSSSSIDVALSTGGENPARAEITFNMRKAKWRSRYNYRAHPDRCMPIRDYERSFTYRHYRVTVDQRFQDGGHAIWRCTVRWQGAGVPTPQIAILDTAGIPLPADCAVLESQLSEPDDALDESRLFVSVKLPADCEDFLIVASDEEGRAETGFAGVEPAVAETLRHAAVELMKTADDADAYGRWLAGHRATPGELHAQLAVRHDDIPLSIIIDGSGGPEGAGALERTLQSLRAQTHSTWKAYVVIDGERELPYPGDGRIRPASHPDDAVSDASGAYVAFMQAGDWLEPDALYRYVCRIEAETTAHAAPDVLYCDEDEIGAEGELIQPAFKSRLNVDAQYSGDWVGNLCAFRRSLLREMPPCDEAMPVWRYDRVLRAIEQKARFAHVPHLLYHAQRRPFDAAAMGGALQRHLDRTGVVGSVEPAFGGRRLRIRYDAPEGSPLVSVIIPTKDHVDLLDACITSLLAKATYEALEVLVVENNSVEEATFAYYDSLEREQERVRILRWPGAFNFPEIVNFAASQAHGDVLLLLNNDTEVIEPSFLEEMLGLLQREEVGVVGAKLLFKDGLVQHAGAAVGVWDAIAHVNQNRSARDGGYLDRACIPGEFSAVTGACQMIRKDVFDELGGYDEEFAVGFNDIDFCLRAQEAGYLVAYTPYALLYHYEFATRGREIADDEKMRRWKVEQARFMERWPSYFLDNDPYTGPNLMRNNTYFRLA